MKRKAAKRIALLLAVLCLFATQALAASPVVAGSAITDTENADNTSHTHNLPASISAGNYLLGFFCSDGTPTSTWPAGWKRAARFGNGGSGAVSEFWWKWADGTEGSTVAITTSASERTASRILRITGALNHPPEVSNGASSAGSTTPDPDALAPAALGEDYLWFAYFGTDNAGTTTAYPTNYTNGVQVAAGGGGASNCTVNSAERALNASSEDPGTFTQTGSQAWGAVTVAVFPATVTIEFPFVASSVNTDTETSDNTTFEHAYPSDIDAGNLLLMHYCTDGTPTVTFPMGWNAIFTQDVIASARAIVAWKEADGTETGTFTITKSAGERGTSYIMRILHAKDPDTQPPQVSTSATATSTTPDPDSGSPTGGAKDYLWLAAFTQNNASTLNATPANYSYSVRTAAGGGGTSNCAAGTIRRYLNASSEDPGSFTIASSNGWRAYTIAVHPEPFSAVGDDGAARRRLITKRPQSPVDWFLRPRAVKAEEQLAAAWRKAA